MGRAGREPGRRALLTDWSARPPGDRNLVWWMFTAPEARKVFAALADGIG